MRGRERNLDILETDVWDVGLGACEDWMGKGWRWLDGVYQYGRRYDNALGVFCFFCTWL